MELNKENVLAHYKESWNQHKTAEFFWVSTTKIRSYIWYKYKKNSKINVKLVLETYKSLWSIEETRMKLWLKNDEVLQALWDFRMPRPSRWRTKYKTTPRDRNTMEKLKKLRSNSLKAKKDDEFEEQIRRNNELNEKRSKFYWFKK